MEGTEASRRAGQQQALAVRVSPGFVFSSQYVFVNIAAESLCVGVGVGIRLPGASRSRTMKSMRETIANPVVRRTSVHLLGERVVSSS